MTMPTGPHTIALANSYTCIFAGLFLRERISAKPGVRIMQQLGVLDITVSTGRGRSPILRI